MKKIITKSDDYGFTRAITDGIIYGCQQGVITCTGLFSNMPSAAYAVERMKDYPDVCLGQDINIVAGYPVSDPKLIPNMVRPDGHFLDAQEHRAIDVTLESKDHLVYEECFTEVENQVKKFIELAGKKPEYIQGHSYGTATLKKAIKDVGDKYGIPVGDDLTKQFNIIRAKSWNIKPFPVEQQMATDVKEHIVSGKTELEKLEDGQVGLIPTHCGYVDQDVFEESTYTIIRLKDLAGLTSPEFKQWLKDNDMELVSYRDLLNSK